jgi:hypothetical protein
MDDNNGWVKLWRQSIENGWLQNHKLWVFWCYCLMKASHKEHKVFVGNRRIKLEDGQFIFGRKKAAEETGLSERQTRTCLDSLRKLGNVTSKPTNKFSIVTICNWGFYQGEENGKKPPNLPTTCQQPATNKNVKNIYIDHFDSIWNKYPRKIGKPKAFEKFKKTVKTEEDWNNINKALNSYLVYVEKHVSGNKYISHGSTWFNNWKNWIEYEEPEIKRQRDFL